MYNYCLLQGYRDKILPDLDTRRPSLCWQDIRINELYFKADGTEISRKGFEVLNGLYDFLGCQSFRSGGDWQGT